jgi:hypothetical protein
MIEFTTTIGTRLDEVRKGQEHYVVNGVRKGNNWLRIAGIDGSGSNDLAWLAYECWTGMSEYLHRGPEFLDDDYEVAGDVLDELSDHDCELLVEVVPAIAREVGEPVGGMTPEATAVHTVLLEVVGAMRERWQDEDRV